MSVNIQKFSKIDQGAYLLLARHFEQIINSKSNSIKGLFWAHNGHIFNIYSSDKKTGKISGYAGGILKATLGNKYFCIIQEFDEGSFNAYHKKGAKNNDKTKEYYVLGPVTVEASIENSFGSLFREVPENYLFVSIEALTLEPDKYLLQHLIGAQYLSTKNN